MNNPGGCILNESSTNAFRRMAIAAGAMSAAVGIEFARPASIDPRSWSKLRNQSSEGSCNGHAVTAAQEQCCYASTGEFRQFSPDYAYYKAQKFDGIRGDSGSTVSGAMRVAKELGAILETMMPYTPRYNPGDIPINADDYASQYRVATAAELKSYADVVNWLGKGFGGVWWGTSWSPQLGGDGYVRSWGGGGGGHATALMGYGGPEDSDGLPEFLWLKNSWGPSFGLDGWCKLTRKAFEQALRNQWTVVAGISDMVQLKPRQVDWRKASVFQ